MNLQIKDPRFDIPKMREHIEKMKNHPPPKEVRHVLESLEIIAILLALPNFPKLITREWSVGMELLDTIRERWDKIDFDFSREDS